MAKARIHLEGLVPQEVKKDDKEVRFRMVCTMMLDEQRKQNVNYIVKVERAKWEQAVQSTNGDDDILVIEGEPYLGLTAKGTPYVEVACFNVFIKQFVQQEDASYFKKEEVEEVPLAHIDLVEPIHLNAMEFSLEPNLTNAQILGKITMPLTVRILNNGRLGLVSGLKNYLVAKRLGLKTVPVIFRNMTNAEWLRMRGIDPTKSFEWRHSRIKKPRKSGGFKSRPATRQQMAGVKEVALNDIIITSPKFLNARLNPQKTKAEKDKIKSLGRIDEPLLVRLTPDGKYDLMDGLRRLTIAKELGFETVPVKIIS